MYVSFTIIFTYLRQQQLSTCINLDTTVSEKWTIQLDVFKLSPTRCNPVVITDTEPEIIDTATEEIVKKTTKKIQFLGFTVAYFFFEFQFQSHRPFAIHDCRHRHHSPCCYQCLAVMWKLSQFSCPTAIFMTHKIENSVATVDREFIGIAESELFCPRRPTCANIIKNAKICMENSTI